ncbi:MAG: hypothetical protein Q7S65_05945, partial [Nanoarchaeota archaeon]|nr:hypothetical protein [Nanoarchaeota archaeon]
PVELSATVWTTFDLVTVFSYKNFAINGEKHVLSATRINATHILIKIDDLRFLLQIGTLSHLDFDSDGTIELDAAYQGVFENMGRVVLRLPTQPSPAPVEEIVEAPVAVTEEATLEGTETGEQSAPASLPWVTVLATVGVLGLFGVLIWLGSRKS